MSGFIFFYFRLSIYKQAQGCNEAGACAFVCPYCSVEQTLGENSSIVSCGALTFHVELELWTFKLRLCRRIQPINNRKTLISVRYGNGISVFTLKRWPTMCLWVICLIVVFFSLFNLLRAAALLYLRKLKYCNSEKNICYYFCSPGWKKRWSPRWRRGFLARSAWYCFYLFFWQSFVDYSRYRRRSQRHWHDKRLCFFVTVVKLWQCTSAAHIGVGIAGVEGTAATSAADYAIGTFRLLHRLLFVHGYWSYHRIAFVVKFIFYKVRMTARAQIMRIIYCRRRSLLSPHSFLAFTRVFCSFICVKYARSFFIYSWRIFSFPLSTFTNIYVSPDWALAARVKAPLVKHTSTTPWRSHTGSMCILLSPSFLSIVYTALPVMIVGVFGKRLGRQTLYLFFSYLLL